MNEEELNNLIEKYYNGNTSEEEERQLRDYLKNDDIPGSYLTEKALFGYYTSEKEVTEPSFDFEGRIMSGIDTLDSKTDFRKSGKSIIHYLSIAAGILIMISISFLLFSRRNVTADTFKDPEIAYAETMKILTGISSQLNYGRQTLEPVARVNEITEKSFDVINRSTIKIDNNIRNILNLQKAIEDTDQKMNSNINNNKK